MESSSRLPQNHYFDSDADDRELAYTRWRKIVSAHCTMRDHRAPMIHDKNDHIQNQLGPKPADATGATQWDQDALVQATRYDASNAYLYSFLTLAVQGQQLDTIVLHDTVPESDGRAAIIALDKKNQGKAIVDVLKSAQRLFNTPQDDALNKPEIIATHITKQCAALKNSTYNIDIHDVIKTAVLLSACEKNPELAHVIDIIYATKADIKYDETVQTLVAADDRLTAKTGDASDIEAT